MRNATRTLAFLLSVLMVLSCLAGMTFTAVAEDADPFAFTDVTEITLGTGQGSPLSRHRDGQTFAARYDLGADRRLSHIYIYNVATYSAPCQEIRFDVYQWNTDYANTVVGKVLFTYTKNDHADCTSVNIDLPTNSNITGDVLIVATCIRADGGITPWKANETPTEGVTFFDNGVECDAFCMSVSTASCVDPFTFTDVKELTLGAGQGSPLSRHRDGQTFAARYDMGADRRLSHIYIYNVATYSAACQEIRFDVYQWNTDYANTVVGKSLFTYTKYDHADCTAINIDLPTNTNVSGDVLIVATCVRADSGITPWKANETPTEGVTFFDNGVACDAFCMNISTAAAVELEEPEEPEDPFAYTGVQELVFGVGPGNPLSKHPAGQSFAARYNVGADRRLASFKINAMATYTAACQEIRYDVYQWNTDYDTTVAGKALFTYTEHDHGDNQDANVPVPNTFCLSGDLLIVTTCVRADTGITPWLASETPTEGVTFFDNGVECAAYQMSITTAAYVDVVEGQMEPTYKIDFGKYVDDADATYGFANANQVTYDKTLEQGYITFTAQGGDPYVWINNVPELKAQPAKHVDNIVIKYRTNSASMLEMFVQRNDGVNPGQPGSHVASNIIPCALWQYVVIDASSEWGVDANLTLFRLDPMCGPVADGFQIDIAEIVFFANNEAAQAYAASGMKELHVKKELVEDSPEIFSVGGSKWTANTVIKLLPNLVEVEPAEVEFDTNGGGFSGDTFFLTAVGGAEQTMKDGRGFEYISDVLGSVINAAEYENFAVRGWYGNGDAGEIAAYGYQLGDMDPVFSADFINDAEDAVKGAAGTEYATRFKVNVPTTGLDNGTYNVYILVKHTDGSVYRLAGWGDFVVVVGDGKNVKVDGWMGNDGNVYTINGFRVMNDKGLDTGLVCFACDDGSAVAVDGYVQMALQESETGAMYVCDASQFVAETPETPINPNTLAPVFVLDGEALAPLSPNGIENAKYDYEAGCIRYTSTKADPNAGSTQIPAGTQVARYMVVKYRTECAGARGEVFTGTGAGATGGSNVPFPSDYIADGQWHYLVADLTRSSDYNAESGVINHFRNDCLQAPDQWVEIEYYAFFNTMKEAEYYAENDMHVLPAVPKFTATFKADGEIVKVVEFKAGDEDLTEIPKVPAKEGYTAKWESFTLGDADIVINAIYTEIKTEPVETDPVETDPVETDPAETDPVVTDPVETDPVETDPVVTDPVTEPATETVAETVAESETEAEKTGCKSVVAASAVLALVAVFGTALVIKKKED